MKNAVVCVSLLLVAVAVPAQADPAGREQLKQLLREGAGKGDPLVLMNRIATSGITDLSEEDLFHAAFRRRGDLSPASRRLLSNAMSMKVEGGTLDIRNRTRTAVPGPNDGTLYFAPQIKATPGPKGLALEGVLAGPRNGGRHNVQTALLDPDGVYGVEIGRKGTTPRPLWFRAKVDPPAPPAPEPAPAPTRIEAPSPAPVTSPELDERAPTTSPADTPTAPEAEPEERASTAPAITEDPHADVVAKPAAAEASAPSADTSAATSTPRRGAADALRDLLAARESAAADEEPHTTIAPGAQGPEVRKLQEELRSKGASGLRPDGHYGPKTERAVRDFQRRNGLPTTGAVDRATRAALDGLPTGLQRGARGGSVTELQEALKRHGANLRTDGQFGAKTARAIEDFQRKNGLDVTGRADEATWNALREIGRGERGEEVRELQRLINRHRRAEGEAPIDEDGRFGASTETAVRELQESAGKEGTGRADGRLIDALRSRATEGDAPLLQDGDRAPAVKRLQERLNVHREAAGLPKISEDGMFGDSTDTALRSFQRGTGAEPTGIASPETWDALSQAPSAEVKARPLVEGAEHDEVSVLQGRLNRHREAAGQAPIDEDGKFGPETRRALEDFQSSKGLTTTGQGDQDTIKALDQEPMVTSAPSSVGGGGGANTSTPGGGDASTAGSGEVSTPGADDGFTPPPAPSGTSLRGVKIALDVGHGRTHRAAFDPGAVNNSTGVTEFDLNLQVGQQVASRLRAQGASVTLLSYPRSSTQRLTLFSKGARARGHHLFVSLHHNAANRRAQGSEVLIHSSKQTNSSRSLARAIQRRMVQRIWNGNSSLDRGVKSRALGVLSGAHSAVQTAVLVEGFFLDRPDITRTKGANLASREAVAIAEGIADYWASRSQ